MTHCSLSLPHQGLFHRWGNRRFGLCEYTWSPSVESGENSPGVQKHLPIYVQCPHLGATPDRDRPRGTQTVHNAGDVPGSAGEQAHRSPVPRFSPMPFGPLFQPSPSLHLSSPSYISLVCPRPQQCLDRDQATAGQPGINLRFQRQDLGVAPPPSTSVSFGGHAKPTMTAQHQRGQ